MKERQILFSGPMVRALLAGGKTQTRRVAKPQPEWCDSKQTGGHWLLLGIERAQQVYCGPFDPAEYAKSQPGAWFAHSGCPYGQPGDRLWVRETYAIVGVDGRRVSVARAERMPVGKTLADTDGGLEMIEVDRDTAAWAAKRVDCERWKPAIFMPRWACRLVLEVTEIRVQRLQDISEADAIAEGVEKNCDGLAAHPDCPCRAAGKCKAEGEYIDYGWGQDGFPAESATASYGSLWDSLNAERGFGWKANPWVWAITFKRAT